MADGERELSGRDARACDRQQWLMVGREGLGEEKAEPLPAPESGDEASPGDAALALDGMVERSLPSCERLAGRSSELGDIILAAVARLDVRLARARNTLAGPPCRGPRPMTQDPCPVTDDAWP
jgi:hypothetical protein